MATSPEIIRALAGELGLDTELPSDDAALMRSAARALTTLRARVLGWMPVSDEMDEVQEAALAEAITLQTIFEAEQGSENYLGIDDRLAAVTGLSFVERPALRVSEAARESLAGAGLVRRSPVARIAG